MKILVVAITFGVTLGGLFLFDNYKTQPKEENYAQIVQGLANQNQSKTPTPKPTNKSSKTPAQSKTKTTALPPDLPTPSFSPANTPAVTTQPLPSSPPTATPVQTLISPAPTFTPTFTLAPTPQPTQQNNQITIASLTSPVKQNTTAQLNISTIPDAQCSIKVTLPSGSQSTAKGLETKTADTSGNITWLWKISWNTTPGTATIEVSCSKNAQNFSKILQMEITK